MPSPPDSPFVRPIAYHLPTLKNVAFVLFAFQYQELESNNVTYGQNSVWTQLCISCDGHGSISSLVKPTKVVASTTSVASPKPKTAHGQFAYVGGDAGRLVILVKFNRI